MRACRVSFKTCTFEGSKDVTGHRSRPTGFCHIPSTIRTPDPMCRPWQPSLGLRIVSLKRSMTVRLSQLPTTAKASAAVMPAISLIEPRKPLVPLIKSGILSRVAAEDDASRKPTTKHVRILCYFSGYLRIRLVWVRYFSCQTRRTSQVFVDIRCHVTSTGIQNMRTSRGPSCRTRIGVGPLFPPSSMCQPAPTYYQHSS
jgi:hypothetical protein